MLRMKALEPAAKVQGTSLRMNYIFLVILLLLKIATMMQCCLMSNEQAWFATQMNKHNCQAGTALRGILFDLSSTVHRVVF